MERQHLFDYFCIKPTIHHNLLALSFCFFAIVGCGFEPRRERLPSWECLKNESDSFAQPVAISLDGKVVTFLLDNDTYVERKLEELPPNDLEMLKKVREKWFSAKIDEKRVYEEAVAVGLDPVPTSLSIDTDTLMTMLDYEKANVAAAFLLDEISKYPERGGGILFLDQWSTEPLHESPIVSLASSKNGARFASLDSSGRLIVWNIRDKKAVLTIETGLADRNAKVAVSHDGVEGWIYGDFRGILRFDLVSGGKLGAIDTNWQQTKIFELQVGQISWIAIDSDRIAHVCFEGNDSTLEIDLSVLSEIDRLALAPSNLFEDVDPIWDGLDAFAVAGRKEGKVLFVGIKEENEYSFTVVDGLSDLEGVELGEKQVIIAAQGRVQCGSYPDLSIASHDGFVGVAIPSRAFPVSAMKISTSQDRITILGQNNVVSMDGLDGTTIDCSGATEPVLSTLPVCLNARGDVHAIAQESGAITFSRPTALPIDPGELFWRIINHEHNDSDAKYLAKMLDYLAEPSETHAKVVPPWEPDTDMLSSAISLIASVTPPNTDPKAHRSRLQEIWESESDSKWLKITEALYKARLANLYKSGQASKIIDQFEAVKLASEALAIIQPLADEAAPKPIVLEAMLEAATAKDWGLKELRPYMEKLTKCEPGYLAASVRLAQLLQPPYRSEGMDVAKFATSLSEKVPAEKKDLLYMAVILGASSQDSSSPLTASQWKERASIDQARMTAGLAAAKTHPISSEYYQAAMKYAWGVEDRELAEAAAEMCKPIELRWSHKQWSSASEFAQFQKWLKP